MRPDDFCSSISVAIWIMMLLTRGRSSGRLLASSRMSPAIARGEKFCDDRLEMARTASDNECAKAVVKSASNSSVSFIGNSPQDGLFLTPNVELSGAGTASA